MEMGGEKSLPEVRITVFRQFSNVNWSYRKENPDEYARSRRPDYRFSPQMFTFTG
jgi:hypothetical protein